MIDDDFIALNDAELIQALLEGDERAFAWLVAEHSAALLRVAAVYVGLPTIAEEVLQETWIGVLRGLPQFQAKSSLKTWIFSILINKAKTVATRETRHESHTVPLEDDDMSTATPTVSAERFHPEEHENAGHWTVKPTSWDVHPEERLLSQETLEQVQQALQQLPQQQREVMVLRDIEGWSSKEVCNVLSISETNQRVLLHRARAKVRERLENYLKEA